MARGKKGQAEEPTVDDFLPGGSSGSGGGVDTAGGATSRGTSTPKLLGGATAGVWWGGTGRYRTGDEQAMLMRRIPPEDMANLQNALLQAGLLSGEFRRGVPDTKTQTAFRNLLAFANQIGTTWQEALPIYGQMTVTSENGVITGSGPGGGGGGGSAQPEFVPQVTSTEDLTLALKDASATLRPGGAFDEATIARLVRVYQAQEREEQERAFNAELSGGEVESPTSAETMLRNTIREEDPAGVGAREVAERGIEFFAALDSPVRPSKL